MLLTDNTDSPNIFELELSTVVSFNAMFTVANHNTNGRRLISQCKLILT